MMNGSAYLERHSKHPKKWLEKDRRTAKVSHQHPSVLRSNSDPDVLLSVEFPAAYATPRANSHQSALRPITPLQGTTGKNLTMIHRLIRSTSYQVPVNTPVCVRFDCLPALLTAIGNTQTTPKRTQQNKCRPIMMISGGTLFYENVIRQQMFRNAATSAKKIKSRQVRPAMEKSLSRITTYYKFMAGASLLGVFLVNIYVICTLVRTQSESVC